MNEDLPRIAIIGAGPMGIETALYARFLGYPVTLFEKGEIAAHVREWKHVQLFTPFGMNSSPLGISALQAQDPNHSLPASDAHHTGQDWVTQYLEPLATSDLIRGCLRTHVQVQAIAKDRFANEVSAEASMPEFRLLTINSEGEQSIETADIVIDTSGTWSHANPLGKAGIPAIGETETADKGLPKETIFDRGIPDLSKLEVEPNATFAVLGRGYSSATNVMQLKGLLDNEPTMNAIWITRGDRPESGPIPVVEKDPLPYRDELARAANSIALNSDWLSWISGVEVESIQFDSGEFQLLLSNGNTLNVNHLLANTGFEGDYQMLSGLHLHRCYISGGPMAWAASVDQTQGDCLQQSSAGPDALKTSEGNFFIVGSKAYGKDPRFLYATGLQQVRDVFKIIAERDNLDLYETMKPNISAG